MKACPQDKEHGEGEMTRYGKAEIREAIESILTKGDVTTLEGVHHVLGTYRRTLYSTAGFRDADFDEAAGEILQERFSREVEE